VLASAGRASGLILRRIGEPIQIDPEFLGELKGIGLVPGAVISADHIDGRIFVSLDGQDAGLALDHDLAAHLFVETPR
jgi:DtxR family Mn-dependent transcriptional regulator